MRKPYLIRTPPFDLTSGGIRVMWGLYGWLLAKGEVVFLNAQTNQPAVGIYPEIYSGNEMGTSTVVRYILNKPGLMGHGTPGTSTFVPGPTEFPKTDILYVFSRIFNTLGVQQDHMMFLPIINTKVFNLQQKKRDKTCYLIGKGVNRLQHPKDAIELNRRVAQDQEHLADLLNECHTLYCYDDLTAMIDIARLCGCEVKYFGEYTPDEMKKYETGLNGVSFSFDKRVVLHADDFRDWYNQMVKDFSDKLDFFIEETQHA